MEKGTSEPPLLETPGTPSGSQSNWEPTVTQDLTATSERLSQGRLPLS